jgi:hypothetical protein
MNIKSLYENLLLHILHIEVRKIAHAVKALSLSTSFELPMSNNDALIGIAQETIIKTLTSHINLDEFMKPFIREVNDDTKNTNKT